MAVVVRGRDEDSDKKSDDDSTAAALPDTGASDTLNTVGATGIALLLADSR